MSISTIWFAELAFSLLVSQPAKGIDIMIKLASVDFVYPQLSSILSTKDIWASLRFGSLSLSNFAVM